MKTVYVCGDSFAVADPEYFDYWGDLLQQKISNHANTVNLGRVSASNLHIALQVERAVDHKADFVILLCTSSIRMDICVSQPHSDRPLLDKFIDLTQPHSSGSLISTSFSYLNNNSKFLPKELVGLLKKVYTNYVDTEVEIFKSKCIIESALNKLQRANIPFLFDQGGFEHPKFAGAKHNYFDDFQDFRSDINLWDYVSLPMPLRPYFHIQNQAVHSMIADYYAQKILEKFQKN